MIAARVAWNAHGPPQRPAAGRLRVCDPAAMNLWDKVLAVLRREATDAKQIAEEAQARADAALAAKERELAATPDERLAMTADAIAESDAAFEELRDEIDARNPEGG